MTIKAHCMGWEFPKETPEDHARFLEEWGQFWANKLDHDIVGAPTAADLDAVAEEQKAKEQTSGKTDHSQP